MARMRPSALTLFFGCMLRLLLFIASSCGGCGNRNRVNLQITAPHGLHRFLRCDTILSQLLSCIHRSATCRHGPVERMTLMRAQNTFAAIGLVSCLFPLGWAGPAQAEPVEASTHLTDGSLSN